MTNLVQNYASYSQIEEAQVRPSNKTKTLTNLLRSQSFAARALEDFLMMRLYDSEKGEYVEKASMMWIWILTQDPRLDTQSQSLTNALKNIYDGIQRPFSS